MKVFKFLIIMLVIFLGGYFAIFVCFWGGALDMLHGLKAEQFGLAAWGAIKFFVLGGLSSKATLFAVLWISDS